MQYNITYRQKDKGWQYIISFKKDEDWKQRSKQGFRTKALAKVAADKRLEDLKKDFTADVSTENKSLTFHEFTEKFLEDMKRYREVNTIKQYKQSFGHFSKLNDIPMEDITYSNIQDCVSDILDHSTIKVSTLKLHISRIKTLFNRATKKPYNVISKTPLDEDIELPAEKEEDKKIKALTKSELDRLLDIIKPEKDYIICLIAATCGLRVGEILGLTWSDIDENNKVLRVYEQWKELKDGSVGFGSVKRQNSNREVPIPNKTMRELIKYKKNNPTDIYNRIIIDKHVYAISKRVNPKLVRYGFDATLHDLRHTYATNLVANGIDFKTIAKLMGHDVEQTLKTYSHVTDDMLQNATNVLNSIFN